jgi:hypothetical protein
VNSRAALLDVRQRVQGLALERFSPLGVSDPVTEADEMYPNAGERGDPSPRPGGPAAPSRESIDSARGVLHGFVVGKTQADCVVTTDEWPAYDQLPRTGRTHRTVHPGKRGDRERARDDDGDGIREVPCHTMEGFWTGRRNFLRPFRGVSKWLLGQYVAFCAALYNYAARPLPFLAKLLRPSPRTAHEPAVPPGLGRAPARAGPARWRPPGHGARRPSRCGWKMPPNAEFKRRRSPPDSASSLCPSATRPAHLSTDCPVRTFAAGRDRRTRERFPRSARPRRGPHGLARIVVPS